VKGSGQVMFKQREKLLFLKKKQQKNVLELGRGGFRTTVPNEQKFLRRFFQKAAAYLFPLKPLKL
jgi:hypothetical protein